MNFSNERYQQPKEWFRKCGSSGLQLPAISLGAWHNFGDAGTDSLQSASESDMMDNCRAMLRTAFDLGITHFDLANNYGPPPGSAEERVGKLLASDFAAHRDELVISSKAGFRMWPGPYGDGGSRKYLITSCEQSLRRLGLDYLDIFYHHRPDPETPLEETLEALDHLVRSGKTLYTGISNYTDPEMSHRVVELCREHGWTVPVIHQFRHHLLAGEDRSDLFRQNAEDGMGTILFSPLAGGLLTEKYLQRIPEDSRAANEHSPFLREDRITDRVRDQLRQLGDFAKQRNQTIAQLALAWLLRLPETTSVLIGASRPSQIVDCAKVLEAPALTDSEINGLQIV